MLAAPEKRGELTGLRRPVHDRHLVARRRTAEELELASDVQEVCE